MPPAVDGHRRRCAAFMPVVRRAALIAVSGLRTYRRGRSDCRGDSMRDSDTRECVTHVLDFPSGDEGEDPMVDGHD
jgi:hypothetical protein